MVREICKDEVFLAQKAEIATVEDLPVADDLLETLIAHKDGCVGMAANMIGVNKSIIAFDNDGAYKAMFNPEIIKKSGPYEAEEGSLSLDGTRKTKRWKSIKVQYQNREFQVRFKTFTGFRPRSSSTRSTTARESLFRRARHAADCTAPGRDAGWKERYSKNVRACESSNGRGLCRRADLHSKWKHPAGYAAFRGIYPPFILDGGLNG